MSETTPDVTNVKILIVDDKEENLIAMQKTLSPLKLEIITAGTGNDALKKMLETDFALILLDVMMPDMNGFEVATLMHQNDATRYIPIIFLTAINKSEQYFIQGMEAGAIDYLYKPVDPTILLSKVRVFVDLYTVRNKLEKTIVRMNEFQTELQNTNKVLKQLSEEDMLTATANRRFFETVAQDLINKCKTENKYMALFFIDVDNFKTINDKNGHSIGDKTLQILASRLRGVEQTPEIQSAALSIASVARLGGDEFAMLVFGLTDEMQQSQSIAKNILSLMATPFDCNGTMLNVGISIGIAIYPFAGDTLENLMHNADVALYKAKESGKNNFVLWKQS